MTKRAELDLKKFGLTATCASLFGTEQAIEGVLLALQAFFASEKQEPYVWSVPASWWQHFKREHFPAWALKRWPVRNIVHQVGVETVYPYLKTQLPLDMCGRTVQVLVNGQRVGAFLPETDGLTQIQWDERAASLHFQDRCRDARKCPCCSRAWFR